MQPGGADVALTRPLGAGAFSFVVASPDPTIIDLAEELFRDLPEPPPDAELSCFTLTPTSTGGVDARYDLAGPVVGTMSGLRLPTALARLVAAISRANLDREPDSLHLHAAGAVRSDVAVVLVGARESGKTTTVAQLAANGWNVISDETIALVAGDRAISGFAKPLSVKPGGRDLVPDLRSRLLPSTDIAPEDVLHVPVSRLGPAPVPQATPGLLAFLRRSSGAPGAATSEAIHPVDAVVRLFSETMDAERYGPRALIELAQLAAQCHCIDLTVGDVPSTAHLIEGLVDVERATPASVEELRASGRIAPNVASVRIGDRVVVHELPRGRVLALDPAGTAVWLTLCGLEVPHDVDLAGPMVAPFVDQLRSMRLVDAGARA